MIPNSESEFTADPETGKLVLHPTYRDRIVLLIEELRKIPDGFISMRVWVDDGLTLEARAAAEANPCGTACCLAGKAGLMKVFQDQGFSWDWSQATPERRGSWNSVSRAFTIPPHEFFGEAAFHALFTGRWALAYIHTPAQAVLMMESFLAFLDETDAARFLQRRWEDALRIEWMPPAEVRNRIAALRPAEKYFPVSRLQTAVHSCNSD